MSDAEKRKRKTGRDAERGHTSGAGLRKKKEKKKQRGVSIGGGTSIMHQITYIIYEITYIIHKIIYIYIPGVVKLA